MKKQSIALLLAISVAHLFFAAGLPAQDRKTDAKDRHVSMVKKKINRAGTGIEARVNVTLRDNTKLNGYIGAIGADSFTAVDFSRGSVEVPYSEVVSLNTKKGPYGRKVSQKTAVVATIAFIIGYGIFLGAVWDK